MASSSTITKLGSWPWRLFGRAGVVVRTESVDGTTSLLAWPCRFTDEHVELVQHLVHLIELLLQRLLLVQQLLSLLQQLLAARKQK